MAATAIQRYAFIDDDGSNTVGDVWNAALIGTSIYNKIDLLATNRYERSAGLDVIAGDVVSRSLIAQGVATNVTNFVQTTPVSGPHFGFVAQIAGMTTAGTASYKVAGYFAAETAARGDGVYALNAVAQWNAGHPTSNVIAFEVDVANNNADLALGATPYVSGILVVSGGTKKAGQAIIIYASNAPTNSWRSGINITGVSDIGIEIGGPTAGLTGALMMRQLANNTTTCLLQRFTDTSPTGYYMRAVNAVNNAELFTIDIAGNFMTVGTVSAGAYRGGETGSWTPVLNFGGATTGITYAVQAGTYTRFSDMVFIELRIQLTSKGSATGTATITGLSFASANPRASGWLDAAAGMTGLTGAPFAVVSASTIFPVQTSGTNRTQLNETHFTNTSDIRISITYKV